MGKLTFVLGGARSGKSTFAAQLAKKLSRKVVYFATATPSDAEMKLRIRKHRRTRPRHWKTIEEPLAVLEKIEPLAKDYEVIVLDCLTLWVSNLLIETGGENEFTETKEREIASQVSELAEKIKSVPGHVIVVSNEVGSGIVPAYKLGRVYRDIMGQANQIMAYQADEVYLIVSGIPLKIK